MTPKIYRVFGSYPRLLNNENFIRKLENFLNQLVVFGIALTSALSSKLLYLMSHISIISMMIYGFALAFITYVMSYKAAFSIIDICVLLRMRFSNVSVLE